MAGVDAGADAASFEGASVALAPDAVHCWLISLAGETDDGLLDDQERARAARFHFERDRRRFIAGHDAIRRILARYVNTPPDLLQFTISEGGRPSLTTSAVNFNYSCSDEWGLLGVSRAAVLGVDIEAVRASDDLCGVAHRMFSLVELDMLNALSDEAWIAGFFNCWTRKEAVVKAMGDGLAAPLQSFDVSLQPGDDAKILRAVGACDAAKSWALRAFTPEHGYRAAIVTDIPAPNLHVLRELAR